MGELAKDNEAHDPASTVNDAGCVATVYDYHGHFPRSLILGDLSDEPCACYVNYQMWDPTG